MQDDLGAADDHYGARCVSDDRVGDRPEQTPPESASVGTDHNKVGRPGFSILNDLVGRLSGEYFGRYAHGRATLADEFFRFGGKVLSLFARGRRDLIIIFG